MTFRNTSVSSSLQFTFAPRSDERVEFEYLIVNPNQRNPASILAFSGTATYFTTYIRAAVESSPYHLISFDIVDPCIDANGTAIHSRHPIHSRLHSLDSQEVKLQHIHMQPHRSPGISSPIRVRDMRLFLQNIIQCQDKQIKSGELGQEDKHLQRNTSFLMM